MQETKNYQLNQWEATDKLSREDFNADNAAIDAAIKAVETAVGSKASAESVSALSAALGSGGKTCRIAWGTYTGSGTYGAQSKNTLTFDFVPLVVKVFPPEGAYMAAEMLRGGDTALYNSSYFDLAWEDRGVSWHNTSSAYNQLNHSGATYHYIAFGYSA